MNGNVIKGLAGLAVVVLSGIGIWDAIERKDSSKKIDMSMKELKNASVGEIKEAMMEKAVKEAAEERVNDYMNAVKNSILCDARDKLKDEARRAVLESSEAIKKEVGEKISKEVELIDISEMKKSAREKAEEKILNKFNGDLDDLLVKYNDQLSNVQKIYRGIADAIGKDKNDEGKGLKFTIG